MPSPVELETHDPRWAARATAMIAGLHAAAPGVFVALHHIGSTALPALVAKPVIDLLGETDDLASLADRVGEGRPPGFLVAGEAFPSRLF